MTRLASWSSIGGTDEDDPLLEKARENVVGALAAAGLFDYYRYDGHVLFCG